MCLAAKADGTRLLPMIVFKGEKRETAAMDKEFKNGVIASSAKTWMNTELTHVWMNTELTHVWVNTELTHVWVNE